MTTITTPFRRSPRTLRTPFAPASKWGRRAVSQFHRIGEYINSDDRASLCELTLRPHGEARTAR